MNMKQVLAVAAIVVPFGLSLMLLYLFVQRMNKQRLKRASTRL